MNCYCVLAFWSARRENVVTSPRAIVMWIVLTSWVEEGRNILVSWRREKYWSQGRNIGSFAEANGPLRTATSRPDRSDSAAESVARATERILGSQPSTHTFTHWKRKLIQVSRASPWARITFVLPLDMKFKLYQLSNDARETNTHKSQATTLYTHYQHSIRVKQFTKLISPFYHGDQSRTWRATVGKARVGNCRSSSW